MRKLSNRTYNSHDTRRDSRGVTLIEILASIAVVGILSAMVASNIKELQNPIANAGFQISHFLRLARSRAISQTAAVTVSPSTSTRLVAGIAEQCGDTTTPVSGLILDLPNGTNLTSGTWSICFTARGLASSNVTFDVVDRDGSRKTIEVALGGGVQIR